MEAKDELPPIIVYTSTRTKMYWHSLPSQNTTSATDKTWYNRSPQSKHSQNQLPPYHTPNKLNKQSNKTVGNTSENFSVQNCPSQPIWDAQASTCRVAMIACFSVKPRPVVWGKTRTARKRCFNCQQHHTNYSFGRRHSKQPSNYLFETKIAIQSPQKKNFENNKYKPILFWQQTNPSSKSQNKPQQTNPLQKNNNTPPTTLP